MPASPSGMTLGRFTGGWFIDRYSRVTVVRGSAVMGALGIGLIIFVDNPWVAGISVLLWGIGASLGFPADHLRRQRYRAGRAQARQRGGDHRLSCFPRRAAAAAGFLGEHFGLRSYAMVVLGLVMVAALVARAVAKPQSEPVMENS